MQNPTCEIPPDQNIINICEKNFTNGNDNASNISQNNIKIQGFTPYQSDIKSTQLSAKLKNSSPISTTTDQNLLKLPFSTTVQNNLNTSAFQFSQSKVQSGLSSQNETKSNLSLQNSMFYGKNESFFLFSKYPSSTLTFNFQNNLQSQNYGQPFRLHQSNSGNINNNSNEYYKTRISPSKLNFLPTEVWKNDQDEVALDKLISNFFRSRLSSKIRFEHKLWNALQITRFIPQLFSSIGVKWVSKTIFKVNQEIFGNLLDLKKVTSALFTSKGYFPSYGFNEVPVSKVMEVINDESLSNESDECRFLEHNKKLFRMDSTENEIASIQSDKALEMKHESPFVPFSSLSSSTKVNNDNNTNFNPS